MACRALAALGLVLLASCSAIKTAYQQGDRLAYWWIDGYVDIQDAQEPPTREAISRFLAWHRQQQVPQVITLLERARQQVQQPMTPQAVRALQQESQTLAHAWFRRAIPDTAALLLSLSPEQVGNMEKKLAEGNAKYRREFMRGDAEDRNRARFKKVMSYAELVYGGFSAEQEAEIRQAIQPIVDGTQARYAERERRQQAWLAMVRKIATEHPGKAEAERMLETYAEQWMAPNSPARRAQLQANTEAGVAVAVQIANLTTAEQKQHAVKRLQGWIDDAQSLTREAPAQGAAAN